MQLVSACPPACAGQRRPLLPRSRAARAASAAGAVVPADEAALDRYLDTLKWDEKGLVVAIAQARARRRASPGPPAHLCRRTWTRAPS